MTADSAFIVFPWSANFETGIAAIDEQHQVLVGLINKLATALSHEADTSDLEAVFGELAAYADYHFRTEEEIWRTGTGDAAEVQDHVRVHAAFLPKVLELRAAHAALAPERALGEVLKFLVNWLVFHILDSDRRMAKVVQAVAQGLPADAARRRADEEMSGLMKTFVATIMSMYEDLTVRSLALIQEKNARARYERALAASESEKRSVDRLLASMEKTIAAMAATIEVRSPYTAGHQRRVAALVQAICGELGLPADETRGIYLAAMIHDIGDVQVPAEILVKSGPLTTPEFALIQQHPEVGYEILKDIDFPWPIAEIVRQHHERLDGSGYPRGLSGDAVLRGARIVAIADVVEAMSSHRPYRPAHGVDAALQEILSGREALYDAAAVNACVRLFRDKGFQFAR